MGDRKLNKILHERRWESNSIEAKSVNYSCFSRNGCSDVASKRCEGVSSYDNDSLRNGTITKHIEIDIAFNGYYRVEIVEGSGASFITLVMNSVCDPMCNDGNYMSY